MQAGLLSEAEEPRLIGQPQEDAVGLVTAVGQPLSEARLQVAGEDIFGRRL